MHTSTFIVCAVFTPADTTDLPHIHTHMQFCAELEAKITTVKYKIVKPIFNQQAIMF